MTVICGAGRIHTAVLLVILVAGCAAPVPPPSAEATLPPVPSQAVASPSALTDATLVVVQADLGGNGLYTEGAHAFVEIRTAEGLLAASAQTESYHLAQELLRTDIPAGDYRLVTYVRPCAAACPAMDAPTDGCEAGFSARAAGSITITIRRSVSERCVVDLTSGP